jgi:hypothetical protein
MNKDTHGKKRSQCWEPLVVVGCVPIAVFPLEVSRTRSTGVLTGEGRAELAAVGNIGREALRRCNVLIGNFVLPNNISKKTWGRVEKRVHTGKWSTLGPADRILDDVDVKWVM